MHTCVRGSSISCHTVAVPIMAVRYLTCSDITNRAQSVSNGTCRHTSQRLTNLLSLLQYIPLEVNLVYQIIKIISICRRAESSKEFNPAAQFLNPLNPELNPICYLLALLRAHHSLHVNRIRVKLLTFRLLMSYIWSTHS